MLTHEAIWQGIDRLAGVHGLTPSGLARRAGLDPTTFNPSKRTTKHAKPRWPSTESLAKILEATDTPFDEFVALITGDQARSPGRPERRLPLLPFDEATLPAVFDDAGFPIGERWELTDFPAVEDRYAYALEIRGSACEPVYRDGDVLVLSPTAQVRKNDRILIRATDRTLIPATLLRKTAQRLLIHAFGAPEPETRALTDVAWLARIVWASQ